MNSLGGDGVKKNSKTVHLHWSTGAGSVYEGYYSIRGDFLNLLEHQPIQCEEEIVYLRISRVHLEAEGHEKDGGGLIEPVREGRHVVQALVT